MYMRNSDPDQQRKEAEIRSNAYIKQMRSVAPGHLALWDPTPWKSNVYEQVTIGDVGFLQEGQFRRLFNITQGWSTFINGGRVPANFEPIPFDAETDTSRKFHSTVVDPYVLYSGAGRLSWERVDEEEEEKGSDEAKQGLDEEDGTLLQTDDTPGEPSTVGVPQSSDESALESEENPNADPKSMLLRYHITKTTGAKTTAYALVAPALIEEQVLLPKKMDEWKAYMEKHHKDWIKFVEFEFAAKWKSDELILIRGWVKTKKWAIATMESPGNYTLDIDTKGYMQATLKLGSKVIAGGVRCGSDRSSAQERTLRSLAAQMGQTVDPVFTTPRTRCLFIMGLKLENDFWAPKRIVAAAEPQDGSSDRDFDHLSTNHVTETVATPVPLPHAELRLPCGRRTPASFTSLHARRCCRAK